MNEDKKLGMVEVFRKWGFKVNKMMKRLKRVDGLIENYREIGMESKKID